MEIHSFVSNVMSQQRYTNRLITMLRWLYEAVQRCTSIPQKSVCLKAWAWRMLQMSGHRLDVSSWDSSNLKLVRHYLSRLQTTVHRWYFQTLEYAVEVLWGYIRCKWGFWESQVILVCQQSLYNQQTQNATTSLLDLLDTFLIICKRWVSKDVKYPTVLRHQGV